MRNGWSLIKRKSYLFIIMLAGVVTILVAGFMMTAATPERTIFSNTSNKELNARVSRLVKDVRNLVYAHKNKDRQLLDGFDKNSGSEIPANERKRLKAQWIKESDLAHDSFMREYKERYWADAILLRNELYRRLPKSLRQPQLSGIYQYPTNVLGVEAIADNLELLSKSLAEN